MNAIKPTIRSTNSVRLLSSARTKRDKRELVPHRHVHAIALQSLKSLAYLQAQGSPLVFTTTKEFHKGLRRWIEKKVITRDKLPRRVEPHRVAWQVYDYLITHRLVSFQPRQNCKSVVTLTDNGRSRIEHPAARFDRMESAA